MERAHAAQAVRGARVPRASIAKNLVSGVQRVGHAATSANPTTNGRTRVTCGKSQARRSRGRSTGWPEVRKGATQRAQKYFRSSLCVCWLNSVQIWCCHRLQRSHRTQLSFMLHRQAGEADSTTETSVMAGQ